MSATTRPPTLSAPDGDFAVSPPARGTRWRSASAIKPSRNPCSQDPVSSDGRASERKAASGRAPMAARSLRPRARQRWPTLCGGCQSRRKWTFSSERSVVTTSSSPRRGRNTAQSSPMPKVRIPSLAPTCRQLVCPKSNGRNQLTFARWFWSIPGALTWAMAPAYPAEVCHSPGRTMVTVE